MPIIERRKSVDEAKANYPNGDFLQVAFLPAAASVNMNTRGTVYDDFAEKRRYFEREIKLLEEELVKLQSVPADVGSILRKEKDLDALKHPTLESQLGTHKNRRKPFLGRLPSS